MYLFNKTKFNGFFFYLAKHFYKKKKMTNAQLFCWKEYRVFSVLDFVLFSLDASFAKLIFS